MTAQKTYTAKHSFPHQGRIVRPGETVSMHPRQAKYLLGTHLERPAAPAKPGKDQPAEKNGGSKQ